MKTKECKNPENNAENNALAVHNLTLLSIEKKKENRRLKEERELEDRLKGITKRILSCAEDGKFSVFIEGDLINPEGRFSESAVERELRNSGYRLEIAMDVVPVCEGSNRKVWKKGMRIYWDMKEPAIPEENVNA
jgi:hypothetical protein